MVRQFIGSGGLSALFPLPAKFHKQMHKSKSGWQIPFGWLAGAYW
jgi:hypothetical protein